MPSPRNLYIPKDWDVRRGPRWLRCGRRTRSRMRCGPDWGGGSPREVLSAEEYERFQAAYDEHSRLRELLDDYSMRRKIVAQSKRPICWWRIVGTDLLYRTEFEALREAERQVYVQRADHPAWVLHPPLVMPWWVWDGKDPFHPFGNATDQELAETGWKGLGL